jgi:hypothetical protein
MTDSAARKLTRTQRLLRPVISLIMRRVYPNCAFLAGKLRIFDRRLDDPDSMTMVAALLLVRATSESKKASRTIRINGFSRDDAPDGSWRVVIERLPDVTPKPEEDKAA